MGKNNYTLIILLLIIFTLSINSSSSSCSITFREPNDKILEKKTFIEKLSSIQSPQSYCGVKVIDNLLYVCDHGIGLRIYDVNIPESPILLGMTNDPGIYHGFDIDLTNKRAYLACLEEGLIIFDISDNTNPNRIGSYDIGEQKAAEVSSIPESNLVFVSEFENGLELFNVSDPTNPKKINSYSTYGTSFNVQIQNNTLFMDGGGAIFLILNISDPYKIIKIGQYYDTEQVRYFYVENNYSYIVTWDKGFKIVNMTDLGHPKLVSSYKEVGTTFGIYKSENFVYVADWDKGLAIFNVENLSNPELIGNYNDDGGIGWLCAKDNIIYVATGTSILRILRMTYGDENSITISSKQSKAIIGFEFIAIISIIPIIVIYKKKIK